MQTQITIGPATLDTYTFYIALGVLAAGLWQVRQSRPDFPRVLNGFLLVGAGALLAGRLGYVLLNADYFRDHLDEIVSLASPGYWEHAAIVGGLAGWAVAQRLRLRGLSRPVLILLVTLVGMGASLGCISHGCAYGREVFWTDGWLWQLRVDWPDAYTIDNPRLPTQLFTLGWLLVCLILVAWQARRSRTPRLALWLLLFAAGDFTLQFLRIDPVPSIGPLRAPQWADAILACAGITALIWPRVMHLCNSTTM